MPELHITITEFVSEDQPGFVRFVFDDAYGKRWTCVEKVPVVTALDLGPESEYPQAATCSVSITGERTDAAGRDVVTITTGKPWGIEAEDGTEMFDVLREQLVLDEPE